MGESQVEKLMSVVMNNIKSILDVNTIVGQSIIVGNLTIIPVSKIVCGFAAGGSEFNMETMEEYTNSSGNEEITYKLPFGGGSGAGVNIKPIAFLIVDQDINVKVIYLDNATPLDKLLDHIPEYIDKISSSIEENTNSIKNNACKCGKQDN